MSGEFYLEFVVDDQNRFRMLQKAFYGLQKAKQTDSLNYEDENRWLKFFDKKARENFWWPTEEQLKKCRDAEKSEMSGRELSQLCNQMSGGKWTLGDMLCMINSCEYNLISCKLIPNTKTAQLKFYPLAHPYGGTEALKCLVESFGFKVTKDTG